MQHEGPALGGDGTAEQIAKIEDNDVDLHPDQAEFRLCKWTVGASGMGILPMLPDARPRAGCPCHSAGQQSARPSPAR
jgi:hypothetical protein